MKRHKSSADDDDNAKPQKVARAKTYPSTQEKESAAVKESNDEPNSARRVSNPTPFDVLFGRGKPFQGHPGNLRLHKIVDAHRTRYSAARRYDKFAIAEEIVRLIKDAGSESGRFLKRSEQGEDFWEEVSDSEAREKVSHALRGKPRKGDGVLGHSNNAPTSRPSNLTLGPTGGGTELPRSLLADALASFANHGAPTFPVAASLTYSNPMMFPPPGFPNLAGMPPQLPFHRLQQAHVLRHVVGSHYNGIPIDLLTDEQLVAAILQRRQRENEMRLRGLPPNYYS